MAGDEGQTQPKVEGVISIIVKDQNGGEVMFKVKKHTKLLKVMEKYCEKKQIQKDSMRFLHEGGRVTDDDTPESLGMEDGDSIDAVVNQIGGTV